MATVLEPDYILEYATELFALPSGTDRIDRENKVIRGVKILGLDSKNPAFVLGLEEATYGAAVRNPYSYEMEAVRKAAPLYEEARVYLDHTACNIDERGKRTMSPQDTKRSNEMLGWLRNIQVVEGVGLFGDLHYLESHPFSERLLEIADRNSKIIGLSHEAQLGGEKLTGNKITIGEIRSVRRVALITEQPGTTSGLFESKAEIIPAKAKQSIRKLFAALQPEVPHRDALESLIKRMDEKKRPATGILATMTDSAFEGLMDGMDDDYDDDGTQPEDHIKSAMMAAICKAIEDADANQLRKVLEALGLSDSMSDTVAGEMPEDDESDSDDEPKKKPKKKDQDVSESTAEVTIVVEDTAPVIPPDPTKAIFECMAVLNDNSAQEFAADPIILKAMVSLAAEDRVGYAKSLASRKATPEVEGYVPKPRSAPAPAPASTTVTESKIDLTKEGVLAEFLYSH